ncbi:hypothetical protein N9850_05185 [Granulosicoccus sp.]|jgi:hypothetical protein|nr:hypothetical protein [Granulosicoccus sp.]MDB4223144.1 hypothetical protein [Granulosicoccus sp.]
MTIKRSLSLGLALTTTALLVACGGDSTTDSASLTTKTEPVILNGKDAVVSVTQLNSATTETSDTSPVAIDGATQIPYPVYPNGNKYRVGGENGLKIVLFETSDSFEEVDEFYRNLAQSEQMPRMLAMNDYVRYSTKSDDVDPWATYRPGIVIHQFNDDTERRAVGADEKALTNIILSF